MEWNIVGEGDVVVKSGDCADSRTCVSLNNTLTIAYVHPEDRGSYSCSAYNPQGNTTREVHLEVKVKPDEDRFLLQFPLLLILKSSPLELT